VQQNHQKLLKEISETAVEHIEPLYSNCFDGINEKLFSLAEKASNNKIQTEIFDGMRELRSNRTLLESAYVKMLQRSSDELFSENNVKQKPLTILSHEADKQELSLVNHKELEKKLAYSSIVQKANDFNFHALYQLNQRLSILNHGYKIDDESNPFGPARLTQIFVDTTANLELPQRHKDLLIKGFGSCVLGGLDDLYIQCNKLLIDAGILPDLKYNIKKDNHSSTLQTPESVTESATTQAAVPESTIPTETAPTAAMMPDTPQPYAAAHAASAPELYHSIQEILSARPTQDHSWAAQSRPQAAPPVPVAATAPPAAGQISSFGGQPPAAFGQSAAAPQPVTQTAPIQHYNQHQLVESISSLQQHQLPSELVFDPNQIEQTKLQLIQQLSNSGDPEKPHEISGLDADTIDLIGMLFEFMLNDQDLCSSVKALLSHLHTPFLKVALLDKDFFTQHNHPARLLLNSMAKAGARWVEENDIERGVFPKMKSIVDRILLEFEINLELFTEINKDFTQYIEQMKKRAEIAEKRAAESIKGKEKLRVARDQAIREINQRSQGDTTPEFVDQFLREYWLDILVFTLLRKGDNHPLWNDQKTLIEQLIWSTTPKSSKQEQKQVRLKLQDIDQVIVRGFEQLGGYPGKSKELLRKITVHQNKLLDEPPIAQSAPVLQGIKPDTKTEIVTPRNQENIENKPATPTQKAENAEKKFSPELLVSIKELRQIPFGTWFEFTTNAQGDTIKGKLSWYSPATSRYMFVNTQGKQIAVRSMLSLANSMRLGDAVVMRKKQKPLVDRAMLAVYELLKVNKTVA